MKYFYYPGCSLEGTAREYDISTRATLEALGAELVDIESWTCCGASAAESVSELLSYVLPARNLAIAEKMSEQSGTPLDILVPCSACYLNLKKVTRQIKTDLQLYDNINTVLQEDHLELKNTLKVRHLLDVLAKDVDISNYTNRIIHFFNDFSVAPYYGCQCLRPWPEFDNPERPVSMEPLIKETGAKIHPWEMGPKCCGASHMSTKPETGRVLVANILKAAVGTDMIITVCPMCQMNLEAFQKTISRMSGEPLDMTILYLPQFMGLAMGLPDESVRLDLNLSITPAFTKKLTRINATPEPLITESA